MEGTFTHKAEGSLTVSHTLYVCDTNEERAARDLCSLRKTGTRRRIRRQESKFRVQQRRRGKSRHLANDFNEPGAEICIKWEQAREPYLLLLTHKRIFFRKHSLTCFSKYAISLPGERNADKVSVHQRHKVNIPQMGHRVLNHLRQRRHRFPRTIHRD